MKRVLIISPYFPPSNAADMQRVRMSLPYFKSFGWDCEVVAVDERFSALEKDDLLLESIPADIKIHQITASRNVAAGGIAMRSFISYRRSVSHILADGRFDLVYFSTTQFPVCALGAYWKNKFGIPYVIDMQDPWYTGRYQNIEQTSLQYRFVYVLHRFLERRAMKQVDGLISVSQKYLDVLTACYPHIKAAPAAVIPFGAFKKDFEIAARYPNRFKNLLNTGTANIVYIGRGGKDLHRAITPLFTALKESSALSQSIKLYFIGTSYFADSEPGHSIAELARQTGVEQQVVELPRRIGYFHTLAILQKAQALFIPGSDDAGYNASKIHPYILAGKPILSVLNPQSPAFTVLKEYGVSRVYSYANAAALNDLIKKFLTDIAKGTLEKDHYNPDTISKYSAENLTQKQCELFNAAIKIAE